MKKINSEVLNDFLNNNYLDAKCELNYNSIFQLLIAVMLSAQTTDVSVNRVTPKLFEKFPTIFNLAVADKSEVENTIKSIGLAKSKANNIVETAKIIHFDYNDIVPNTMEKLVSLPGVGRKTASVVLIEGYKIPALPVDTHILRVSYRLGICDKNDDPYKTEMELRKLIAQDKLIKAHHQLIFFGRYCCHAKNPECHRCKLTTYCHYFNNLSTISK